MIQQANSENFESLVQDGFVIVDFYGTTCVPCKLFARILEDLDTEIPFLNIVKLNTTDNPQLAAQYHIQAVPTVQFYKDGKLVRSVLQGRQAGPQPCGRDAAAAGQGRDRPVHV